MNVSSTGLPQSLKVVLFDICCISIKPNYHHAFALLYGSYLLKPWTPILIFDAVLARRPGLEMASLSVLLIFQRWMKYEDRAWKFLASAGGRAFRVWTICRLYIFSDEVVVLWIIMASARLSLSFALSPHILNLYYVSA
jgi:hypothetical protein